MPNGCSRTTIPALGRRTVLMGGAALLGGAAAGLGSPARAATVFEVTLPTRNGAGA
jgi:hypothetical protein